VSGWIGCLATNAPQDVTARTVAEDLETQLFCSRGQIEKFFLVNDAQFMFLFRLRSAAPFAVDTSICGKKFIAVLSHFGGPVVQTSARLQVQPG
jgi:hypothetical protein